MPDLFDTARRNAATRTVNMDAANINDELRRAASGQPHTIPEPEPEVEAPRPPGRPTEQLDGATAAPPKPVSQMASGLGKRRRPQTAEQAIRDLYNKALR